MCFQTIKCMQLIHDIFVDELWIVIIIMTLSLILRIHRSKIHVEVYDFLSQYSFWILKHVARIWLISWFNDEFRHSVLPLWSLLRIRLVVILDTKVLWGTLLLLFSELSPAWGTAKVVLLNSPWKLIYLSLSGHWPYHLGAITEYACPSSTYSWRTIPAILPIPEKLAWLSEPSQTFYFSLFWVDPFNDSTSLEIEPHEKQIDHHVVTYIPETIVFSLIWFPKKSSMSFKKCLSTDNAFRASIKILLCFPLSIFQAIFTQVEFQF